MSIHQQESGSGPVLVMLHGLFGDADNFNGIAKLLATDFRVLQLDLPGHGRSTTLPTLSIDAMCDALVSHLSAQGLNKFNLLGHSLGGKVAMCMAAKPSTMTLSKLIVADIAPKEYPPHHQSILQALSSIKLEQLTSRSEADKKLGETIKEASVRAFLLKSLQRVPAVSNTQTGGYQWRFDLQKLIRDYDFFRQKPVLHERIECPTLFIKGELSDYIVASDEAPIRQHFSNPSFKIIGNTGHWLHAEKPAQFARLCKQFLSA